MKEIIQSGYFTRAKTVHKITGYHGLGDDHPAVGSVCFACGQAFQPGDLTVLLPLGPGSDTEARQKAREGRYYNAVAIHLHADCVSGGD